MQCMRQERRCRGAKDPGIHEERERDIQNAQEDGEKEGVRVHEHARGTGRIGERIHERGSRVVVYGVRDIFSVLKREAAQGEEG